MAKSRIALDNFKEKSVMMARRRFEPPAISITLRRHSVNIQPQQHPLTHRNSSKDVRSLKKYSSKEQDYNKQLLIKTIHSSNYLQKDAYRYVNMVGKGGFGKVWKVQHKDTKRKYAMKEISKAMYRHYYSRVITKRSIQSILNERELLSWLRHRYIVNMLHAFQDRDCLFIVMNLMEGGDLRYHLSKMNIFNEVQTKFMVATILLALEYLHSKMIIHRDIKPQNIVFDSRGFAYVTDMGIAKQLKANNADDTSGTPGYMAPEVMFSQSHRFEVDFYALGVVVYEIMMGKRPYLGKNRNEIKLKIKEKQVSISKKEIPQGWTIEAADFVNKLLQRKPVERLGWAGVGEVKKHSWVRNLPWEQIAAGRVQPPVTRHYNHQEVKYRTTEYDTAYLQLLAKNKNMISQGNMQDQFMGYTYQDNTSTCEQTKT